MQSIEEAIGPILTVLFIAALLAERFFAHHTMPERRWWRSIGAVFFGHYRRHQHRHTPAAADRLDRRA